jgi:hypothetical protein
MSEDENDSPGNIGRPVGPFSRQAFTRYLVIPFLVYLLWSLETFLFVGNVHLFQRPEPVGLLLYTLVCCVLVGLVFPVFLVRRAFVSGAVNMFQLGFRSLRRTLLAGSLTVLVICALVALQNPFGPDRSSFAAAFLLLLPAGASLAMICWVLVGTHVQAFVRGGGAPVSISVGTVVTSLLFGLTPLVMFPGATSPELLFRTISLGLLAALFFFGLRDVWASCVAVTGGLVYLAAGQLDVVQLHAALPALSVSAVITVAVLAGIHWYLSRHYVTVPVTPR